MKKAPSYRWNSSVGRGCRYTDHSGREDRGAPLSGEGGGTGEGKATSVSCQGGGAFLLWPS